MEMEIDIEKQRELDTTEHFEYLFKSFEKTYTIIQKLLNSNLTPPEKLQRIINLENSQFVKSYKVSANFAFECNLNNVATDYEANGNIHNDYTYVTYYPFTIKHLISELELDTLTFDLELNEPEPELTENIFCESMPISVAKKHFEQLTKKKNKNGLAFLTESEFYSFIERAFSGNNTIKKQDFNFNPNSEKLIIVAVFYEFYTKYSYQYFNTVQNSDIFIKLLTENFNGFEYKNVKNNFRQKTNYK